MNKSVKVPERGRSNARQTIGMLVLPRVLSFLNFGNSFSVSYMEVRMANVAAAAVRKVESAHSQHFCTHNYIPHKVRFENFGAFPSIKTLKSSSIVEIY